MDLSIDIVATSDQPLTLKLSLANLMTKPLPGVFQTIGPPNWAVDKPEVVTLDVRDNGNTCQITSKTPEEIVEVEVFCSANVDANMTGVGEFQTTSARLTLGPSTKTAGIVMVPTSPNAVVK